VELIAISIDDCNQYLAQSLRSIVYVFGKFPPHICESCGATYRHSYESFSALQSRSIPVTDVENCVQIDP